MMRTAVLRLCGQRSGGPSGVAAQSNWRMRRAMSLSPAKRRSASKALAVPRRPTQLFRHRLLTGNSSAGRLGASPQASRRDAGEVWDVRPRREPVPRQKQRTSSVSGSAPERELGLELFRRLKIICVQKFTPSTRVERFLAHLRRSIRCPRCTIRASFCHARTMTLSALDAMLEGGLGPQPTAPA